jgi:predicted unusual protein kinase regulating ubiquinone biosynthesis (AarF/ABC1/UbiB family)
MSDSLSTQTPQGPKAPARRNIRSGGAARLAAARRRSQLHPAVLSSRAPDEIPAITQGVIERIERKPLIEVDRNAKPVPPPMIQFQAFQASFLQAFLRLCGWMLTAVQFMLGTLFDVIIRRDSAGRRAVRIRKILEKRGGTFIKIGQQMAMRVDLLPSEYCNELSKMLDQVPPFPVEYAITRIELTCGRRIGEIFKIFDPVPIGAASVACVYQAFLQNGEKVAIKIRRPDIGNVFAADLRALDWLCELFELFTLARPGITRNLRVELRTMLMEELDFRQEARYTELYARRTKKRKYDFLTSPKVYYEYSGSDVLVTEYINGLLLGAVLNILESSDVLAMERLEELKIDRKQLAKNLIIAAQFGVFENTFFHADPHPANIVVLPGNKLVFLDFGSCGAYVDRDRRFFAQMYYYQAREDVAGMVRALIALLEPLPVIDTNELTKRAEATVWRVIYAHKSKHSQWWEHTSASLWIGLLEVTKDFEMPMNLNTLRNIRASLLYDTLAARLDPDLNIYKIYRTFSKRKLRRERKEALRRQQRRNKKSRPADAILMIEQVRDLGTRIVEKVEGLLDSGGYQFTMLASKASYVWSSLMQFFQRLAIITAFVWVGYLLYRHAHGMDIHLERDAWFVVTSRKFKAMVVVLIWVEIRKIRYRLSDKDV